MTDFKKKIYNHQTPPPGEIWDRISEELHDEKVVQMPAHTRSRFLFYGATAAASVIIILMGSLIFTKNPVNNSTTSNSQKTNKVLAEKIKDSMKLNQKILESIIHNPREKKEIIAKNSKLNSTTKKYLTVANPEGQPVKISPKVATLIISADHEFPPKPVWDKKFGEWQKIMLSSTVLPTSANLIDLLQMAAKNDHIE